MDTCPECGNRNLRVLDLEGSSILECELCGERFGSDRSLGVLADREEADQHGYPVEVWPLVRSLSKLPGLVVSQAVAGSVPDGRGPFLALALVSQRGQRQIENLARMLQLTRGVLRAAWVMEVEAHRELSFVLRPRLAARFTGADLREVNLDLETLALEVERNRRLQWWN